MHLLNIAAAKLQAVARGAVERRRVRELRITIRYIILAQSAVSYHVPERITGGRGGVFFSVVTGMGGVMRAVAMWGRRICIS